MMKLVKQGYWLEWQSQGELFLSLFHSSFSLFLGPWVSPCPSGVKLESASRCEGPIGARQVCVFVGGVPLILGG